MNIREEIKKICKDVKFDEPLSKHTSFRIGGPAEYFVEVKNKSELVNLLKIARKYNLHIFLLGGGTNLLVKDRGIKGMVIKLLGDFKKIKFGNNSVSVGAGVNLPQLLKVSAQHNLGGMEFLAGIPGTVGGALVMNAGTHLGEIGDWVRRVEIMDLSGKTRVLGRREINFFYRGSNLPENVFILSAEMDLKKIDKDVIEAKIKEKLKRRWATQPREPYQAGSIFKNPSGDYAGRLIEKAGLKGVKYGGAYISEKHGNFIINNGRAKAKDVIYLVRKIKRTVKEKFGIDLELEIKIIGE